jgi:hypothetical protein
MDGLRVTGHDYADFTRELIDFFYVTMDIEFMCVCVCVCACLNGNVNVNATIHI